MIFQVGLVTPPKPNLARSLTGRNEANHWHHPERERLSDWPVDVSFSFLCDEWENPNSPSLSPAVPASAMMGARMSGRLSGVVSLTDVLNSFAKSTGLRPTDPSAQRARRRWTGLGEGGTAEDLKARQELLRCGWGVVREMNWFLDTLLGYVMTDVVDVEFRKMKGLLLGRPAGGIARQMTGSGSVQESVSAVPLAASKSGSTVHPSQSTSAPPLDFTTLRGIHTTYLERLLTGSLLSNPALTNIIRMILEVCERFAAQVERWGGDVLPALLFEGSLAAAGAQKVGDMVAERYTIVGEIDEVL